MDDQTPAKIVCECPNGHRIRADVSRTGDLVACPRCGTKFVFGIRPSEAPSVSDTGVMRILGDMPITNPTESTSEKRMESQMKTCNRCGIQIEESATVCKHCNTYLGSLPGFMKSLINGDSFSEN